MAFSATGPAATAGMTFDATGEVITSHIFIHAEGAAYAAPFQSSYVLFICLIGFIKRNKANYSDDDRSQRNDQREYAGHPQGQ